MSTQLIPCPDCSASAAVKQGRYSSMELGYSYVHCTNPSCHLYRHTLHFTALTPEESDLRAIQSWNERYVDILPAGQIAAREMTPDSRARPSRLSATQA